MMRILLCIYIYTYFHTTYIIYIYIPIQFSHEPLDIGFFSPSRKFKKTKKATNPTGVETSSIETSLRASQVIWTPPQAAKVRVGKTSDF